MINIAFAGLRHGHIFTLYREAVNNSEYNILGAFEENEDAKREAEAKGVICNYRSLDELLADEKVDAVVLPMSDVFASTRKALEIQSYADKMNG